MKFCIVIDLYCINEVTRREQYLLDNKTGEKSNRFRPTLNDDPIHRDDNINRDLKVT